MENSITPETIRTLFEHNYWARDRQLADCKQLTLDQFTKPMGSSFSSVRDTMAHLVGVEKIWLQRWQGETPKTFITPNDITDFDELTRTWLRVEQEMRAYLSKITEEKLNELLTFTSISGKVWSYPLWKFHLHLINHQNYHRGQITTLLRQLGATPRGVDFLIALDEGI